MTEQKHRKRLAEAGRQSTEDVVGIILIQGTFQYVQLNKLLISCESCMKGAEINLEFPKLRQGRVSEPQLGEGTQQSSPPFHS